MGFGNGFRKAFRLTVAVAALGVGRTAHAAFTYPGCPDLTASDFRDVILVNKSKDATLDEPTSMTIGKDGRIFFTERALGNVKMIDVDGSIKPLGNFKVYNGHENGMRYVSVDPDFVSNRWIYLLYSPATPQVNRLARMKLKADWTIDMATVKVLLDMPWTYETGHQGGAMAWDLSGNMYLTTGNNKHNGDNYSVTDERELIHDNGAGTANTNDWRGKILRIKPIPFPDGETPAPGAGRTYSIPAGNFREHFTAAGLYGPSDQAKILPEIYTLGHRNPYTVTYDIYTGWLSWGDIGPDAGSPQADRGPAGNDEFNLIREPGFMGWPYFVGDNLPYVQWDYVNNKSINRTWDVNAPVNASKNNTGVRQLPPARPAMLSESKQKGVTPLIPDGGGTAAITGPIYHYDGSNPSPRKLPPHFDGKWMVGDFSHDWLKVATLGGSPAKVTGIEGFPGGIPGQYRILNLQIGPDGALYYLNYAGWGTTTADTRIGRLEYMGACRPLTPVPRLPTALVRRPAEDVRLLPPGSIRESGLDLPAGYRGVELYDGMGKRVFISFPLGNGSGRRVDVPSALARGVLRARFLK
jgi:cytochrome c